MSGIYFKVLEVGNVKVGDALVLIKRSINTLTIAQLYESKK